MRLFIAVPFAPPVQAALAEAAGQLRGLAEKGRFVHQENLHLTLKFLGEVAPDRVPSLRDALARHLGGRPHFSLALGGVGAFGRRQPLRVVWLGLTGDVAALQRLQQTVEQAAQAAGFPAELRPFAPHVTLARDVSVAPAVLRQLVVPACRFRVTQVALMASAVSGGKRCYTSLARFLLV